MEDTAIYVQPLHAVGATDVSQAGGKGATLARLLQAGLPVPPGCVVTARALVAYVEAQEEYTASEPEEIRQRMSTSTPPALLRQALHLVLESIPPSASGWAVRSSAVSEDGTTASFAGVYESVLEVQDDDLWPSIRACWASWWTERATAYRQRLEDTSTVPRMAVVIQTMVPARCAGVAFTVEPLQEDHTRMVVNAAPGLGVTVVSGEVEPEQYILAKEPDPRVLETRLLRPARPPLLPPDVVVALGALLRRIETLCGCPQDVEWAWDGRHCWILQSRPITTLASDTAAAETVWSNANLKDVMPGLVSPFTWSFMRPGLEVAMRQQYARAGYVVPAERPIIRRFWGRLYFNLSLFQEAAYTLYGISPDKQVVALGGPALRGFTPGRGRSRWQRWRWLRNGLRFIGIAERTRKAASASFAAVQQLWQEELQQPPGVDRATLLHKLGTHVEVTRPFLIQHLFLSMALSGNFEYLRDTIKRLVPQAPPGLVADLVTGLGDVSSAEQSYRLWELSRLARQSPQVIDFLHQGAWHTWQHALVGTPFYRPWQAFLDTFGHRSVYEVEMANPRWREQPDYLFELLASYAKLDQDTVPFDPQEQARHRQAAERQVLDHLAVWRRPWIRTVMRRTQAFSRLRENSKSHLVRLIDMGRCMALVAARFLVDDGLLSAPEAIFLLEIDEVGAALRSEIDVAEITRLITQRRLERQRNAALQPPEAIIGERPFYGEALANAGTALHGLPSSPGRVRGMARVLRTPQEGTRLQAGEILVAPSTDPGWTPLFLLAAGLVMETGGYLSHGAIVAREYGIPAVINVPRATHRIPDGGVIELDGGEGRVWIADGRL
ncbi:Prodigiosin synthesizing transferase PigC [Candidatus Entotheonellaceae bacterium PAL068K]